VCVFFQFWSFENYTSKFRPHLRHKISCYFSPSPFTHLLLSSSSYPWLPMVVSFFLTHLLLEVASSIIFLPSPFRCHWSSRSKGLHWWRRSKAYKLHMELHHVASSTSTPLFITRIFFSIQLMQNYEIEWQLNPLLFHFQNSISHIILKHLVIWFLQNSYNHIFLCWSLEDKCICST